MTIQINRARLLIENYTRVADSITVTPSPLAGFPASNLQDSDRTMLCKVSGSTFNAVINFGLSAAPEIHALALTGLGYSPAAQMRLRANDTNSWGSPKYDSGWVDAYPPVFGFGAGDFGAFGFGGYATPEETPWHRPTAIMFLPSMRSDLWWNFDISDPGASSISLGVLGLCKMIQMPRNFIDGWRIIPVDTTTRRRSTSGQLKAGRPGVRFDRVELEFRGMPHDSRWTLHNAFKRLGSTEPFFLVLHPDDDGTDSPWTTLYGVAEYSGQQITGPNMSDFSLTFEEQSSPA